MIPDEREQLQTAVLRWLIQKDKRHGLPGNFLLACAKSEMWPDLTMDDLQPELEYLAAPDNAYGKALILRVILLSPGASPWKLTAGGRDFAINLGLAKQ